MDEDSSERQYDIMNTVKSTGVGRLKEFTVRDKVNRELAHIEQRKKELLEFKELLDRNEDVEKILNLSRNLGI